MGTFDSVYKNKIRKLEEENQQLRRIINEGRIKDAIAKGLSVGKDIGKEILTFPYDLMADLNGVPRWGERNQNPARLNDARAWLRASSGNRDSDLHPRNPLRVDDADTGSTHHPGQGSTRRM